MKKVVLFLMMALMVCSVYAQVRYTPHEQHLLGTWNPSGEVMIAENNINGPWTVDFILIRVGTYSHVKSKDKGYDYIDFFISDSNKLHLLSMTGSSLNFVIEEFYDMPDDNITIMGLRPLVASSDKIFYYYRVGTSNSIGSARSDSIAIGNGRKFTLNGVETESPKGIYIENGEKRIAK